MSVLDDVFDVLEGTLAELLRARRSSTDAMEHLIASSRANEARCAVAALSALMRDGIAWRPAEDGHEAVEWREHLLAAHPPDKTLPAYRVLVQRELDELVALSRPGRRRPLPPEGTFERLARAAGVPREECRSWARAVGTDLRAGWCSCAGPRSLVRLPLALGVELDHIFRALCQTLLDGAKTRDYRAALSEAVGGRAAKLDRDQMLSLQRAAEDPFARAASTVLVLAAGGSLSEQHVEWMVESALRVVDVEALRDRIATSTMLARLGAS